MIIPLNSRDTANLIHGVEIKTVNRLVGGYSFIKINFDNYVLEVKHNKLASAALDDLQEVAGQVSKLSSICVHVGSVGAVLDDVGYLEHQ